MKPTIVSTILGVLFLALTGPMAKLATVTGDHCTDPSGVELRCADQLRESWFWTDVTAAGIASVAGPWDSLAALLLPMFGIPFFLDAVRKPKDPATVAPDVSSS